MNALTDDPEFQRFLLGQISLGDVRAAYERYQEQRGLGTSFNLWLTRIYQDPSVMQVLHQLYQYDQAAKINKEIYILALVVKKRISKDPARNLKTPITTNEIIDFYSSLHPVSKRTLDGITKKTIDRP